MKMRMMMMMLLLVVVAASDSTRMQLDQVKKRIKELNGAAEIIPCQQAKAPHGEALQCGMLQFGQGLRGYSTWMKVSSASSTLPRWTSRCPMWVFVAKVKS